MTRAPVACLVVAACGDNQQPVEIAVPHGTPAFVAYKANGTWHGAKPTKRGYLVESVGQYQFVFVCADPQGFDVEELFADTSDGDQELEPQASVDACRTLSGDIAFANITGTVAQAGFLELGVSGASAGDSPNWSYDITTVEGRQALVFRPFTADVVVIRRDVEIGPGTNPQPIIDTSTEAIDLTRMPLSFAGTSLADRAQTMTTLITADGEHLVVAFAAASPLLLPGSQLEAGERQLVDVNIDEQPQDTSTYLDHVRLDAMDLRVKVLPPPDVRYSTTGLGTVVTWQHEPLDAVGFELLVASGGTPSIIHGVATASVSTTSTLDLSVDPDAPGFLDAWRPVWSHDLDSSARAFQVLASRDGGCYETQLVDRGRSTAYTSPTSRCSQLLP